MSCRVCQPDAHRLEGALITLAAEGIRETRLAPDPDASQAFDGAQEDLPVAQCETA